ncbi:MAG: ATP-binding protein [Syntrophobacteraceae bacterium]
MLSIPSSYLSRVYLFAIPSLVLLMAAPLWICAGPGTALLAVPVAAACFFGVRSLIGQIVRAREQKCFVDEQLIQSQKLAAIGELSAGIAHEINNPLAIIAQEIEWARYQFDGRNPDEPGLEEVRDSLREIACQVERCREITHKLLDFARKHDPLIQGVDLNRLVEDMAKLVEKEASQKGIEIVRQYRGDLSPIQTDPPLLRQVVLNLLNNAVYAIGQNGAIAIRTRIPESGHVELEIGDNGCGIRKEDLHKIFDPFYTTKPPGKGTGLGLSICHSIIVRLGGRIAVESEPGKGTTFAVRLPIIHRAQEGE